MTRRVYIRGDLADPTSCEFVDAVDDRPIATIANAQVTVSVLGKGTVDMRHITGAIERAELVPAPPQPARVSGLLPGTELFGLSVTAMRDSARQVTRFSLAADRYVETAHGVARSSAKDLSMDWEVSDTQMMAYAGGGHQYVSIELGRMAEHIGRDLLNDLLNRHVAFTSDRPPLNERGHLGGIREPLTPLARVTRNAAKGFVRSAVKKALEIATCPECKGEGEVQMFNSVVPCSKGCPKT